MPKSLLFLLLNFFIYAHTFAAEKLIFAIDIVRHGDRTPVIASSTMQKVWPQGIGQLTPKGMAQEYELGKQLREFYVNQSHLLPKQYDINTMTVRASGIPRTLMSAESLLFGLYPLGTGPSLNHTTYALPQGFQPIPINMVPREQDSLLVPNYNKERSQHLLNTYILNNPEWIQKNLALKSNYPLWSQQTGTPIHDLSDLIPLGDRLMIEQLYQRPLPQGLSKKEADTIIAAGEWAFLHMANDPKLAAIVGRELAQTINQEITIATQNTRPLKYLLFVAHDTTIAAQLKILGQTLHKLPPYASQINYALFDLGSSHYQIRVTYNQKPLFLKPCGGYSCSLKEFSHLIEQATIA